jgi:hypothetical protein
VSLSEIGVDHDAAVAALRKFATTWEDGNLPTTGQLEQSHGTSVGVTKEFRDQVGEAALALADLMDAVKATFQTQHDLVLATVNELVDLDAGLADSAKVVMNAIEDSAPATTPADGATVTTSSPSSTTQIV